MYWIDSESQNIGLKEGFYLLKEGKFEQLHNL
jgi:hypothetical protein